MPSTHILKPNPNAGKGAAGHSHGAAAEKDAQRWISRPSGSTLCGSCTVLAGQISLFYEDGTFANVTNGVYIHHITTHGPDDMKFINTGLTGTLGFPGNDFVGAGEDNGSKPWMYTINPKDKSESGYQLSPSSSFMAEIMLVNYSTATKNICIAYDLEYLPGHVGKRVATALLSVAGPKTSLTRPINTTSSIMTFKEDGYIVSARGHLHPGGVAMYVQISEGKTPIYTCVSRAIYGRTIGDTGEMTISDISDCPSMPIRIKSGSTMILTSEYDLTKHALRESTVNARDPLMGLVRMAYTPDRKWGL